MDLEVLETTLKLITGRIRTIRKAVIARKQYTIDATNSFKYLLLHFISISKTNLQISHVSLMDISHPSSRLRVKYVDNPISRTTWSQN